MKFFVKIITLLVIGTLLGFGVLQSIAFENTENNTNTIIQRNNTTRFLNQEEKDTITSLSSGTTAHLSDINWKPDGSYALISGSSGTLIKFDGSSFTEISTATTKDLYDISWKPDGSEAVILGANPSGYSYGTIFSYDGSNFESCFVEKNDMYTTVSWKPNGDYAVIIERTAGKILYYYDTNTIIEVDDHNLNLLGAEGIGWKPDGNYALIGGHGTFSKIKNTDVKEIWPTSDDHYIRDIKWHYENEYALVVGYTVGWDPISKPILRKYGEKSWQIIDPSTDNDLLGFSFKPGSSWGLITGEKGTVIKITDDQECIPLSSGTLSHLTRIDWHPDGGSALMVGYNGTVLRYQSTEVGLKVNINGPLSGNAIEDITITCTEYGGNPPYSYAWDLDNDGSYDDETGFEISCFWETAGSHQVKVRVTDDNAVTAYDTATIYLSSSGTLTTLSAGTSRDIQDVQWRPNTDCAYLMETNGRMKIYNASSGSFDTVSLPTTKHLYRISWRPDGSMALILGYKPDWPYEGTVWEYNPETNDIDEIYQDSDHLINAVSWYPNGGGALIGTQTGELLWYEYITSSVTSVCSDCGISWIEDIEWRNDKAYALIVGYEGIVQWYFDGCGDHILSMDHYLRDVDFTSDDQWHIVVGYGTNVVRITRNGVSEYITPSISNAILGFDFQPEKKVGLLVGSEGKLMKFTGSTFVDIPTGITNNLLRVEWKPDGSCALIVGGDGKVLKFDCPNQYGRETAILVGGDYKGNKQEDITILTSNVFKILVNDRGFNKDEVYFMNIDPTVDADEDGIADVDAISSSSNLEYAITDWAADYVGPDNPLVIYLMDHGSIDSFCINHPDEVTSNQLDGWLDTLTATTGCDEIKIIYAACHSGSFVDELESSGRLVITSTDTHHPSYRPPNERGEIFSNAFWDHIQSGYSIGKSFESADQIVNDFVIDSGKEQYPQMDEDGFDADSTYIGPLTSVNENPVILKTPSDHALTNRQRSVDIWTITTDDSEVNSTYALVIPPDSKSKSRLDDSTVTPDLNLTVIPLNDIDGDGNFTGSFDGFDENGIYNIVIYSSDNQGSNSMPSVYNISMYPYDGDMNGDGIINSADIRYLALYLCGDPDYMPLNDEGDVNNNGELNSADVRYLALNLCGDPDYSPLYPGI